MNINNLARHIKDRYDLQKDELTVVFPNKRAALYLRLQFKQIYKGSIWMPQMLSIEEAMSQWSGVQLADNIDLLFELIAIDADLGHKGNSITTFGSMASQMAKDFDEIDQYAVDAQHLFSYVYDDKKIGIWDFGEKVTPKEEAYLKFFKQLKDYYDMLRQRLAKQRKGYYGMITRALAEADGETLRQMTRNQRIIFVGFNALTTTEQAIIDTLYKNGQAEVIWDFDRYYVEDPQNEAGFFARQYIKKKVSWKPTEFSDELLKGEKEIHLVGATGKTIQAKAMQSLLQTETEEDTTLILADENLLIPVMNSIPDNGHYPSINVSMGYPMRQTALNDLVNEFFILHSKGRKLSSRGWYIWPILRILDLEVVKVIFSEKELTQITNYKARIQKESIFIYDEDVFNTECESDDLRLFMKSLLGTAADEQAATTTAILDNLIILLKFIAQKIQADNGSNIFLLNQVSETGKAVNRLKHVIGRHQDYVKSLGELEILYRLVNSNLSIKLNSSATGGLQLMGILETRNLDFESFYMIGVNEGVLPTEKSNSSFIPYYIRKECGLPDYREKQAVYAYHFYRMLQHARRAYFIYNNNSDDNGSEPSRFLMQVEHELAKRNDKIKLFHDAFVNKTSNDYTTPSVLTATRKEDDVYTLSPSSIATHVTCPLKFYMDRVMNIKDNSMEEDTKDNEIGTIIHDTLQQLYENYLNTEISPDLFTHRIEAVLTKTRDEAIKKNYSQGLPDVGFNYLNLSIIDRMLNNYMKFEKDWVKTHHLVVTDVETKLQVEMMVKGHRFNLEGRADRIDNSDGTIRIIDYKTGTVKRDKIKVPERVSSLEEIPDKATQLLIYKYLYLKLHPNVDPNTVTSAIFGLRYKNVVFDLKVDDQELNEHFMDAMEGLLTKFLEKMIDTKIPYGQTEKDKDKPCRFCDYKNICVNTAKGALQEDDH